LAGYGIAIPVGAIAVLIFDTGLRRGLRLGMAAGTGAAASDFVYAALAVTGGRVLTPMLLPYATGVRVLAGVILLALAAIRIRGALLAPAAEEERTTPVSIAAVFLQFLGLTLVNPLTIVYFGALMIGGVDLEGWTAATAFVVGAGLASLSWQWLLAGAGALGGKALPARARRAAAWAGNLIVAGLALRLLLVGG
jgi:arginine exporter protein ArgO